MRLVYTLYLVFVSHGTSATNEYLAAGLYFQLLGCHAARTEQTTDKVELQQLNEQYDCMSAAYHTHCTYHDKPTIVSLIFRMEPQQKINKTSA